jgi:hypothetical protein
VRKELIMDEDTLVAGGVERKTYSTGKTELERAQRGLER